MPFCIIETEAGWTVAQHPESVTAEQAAEQQGGLLLDPGPYATYEDADEALTALQQEFADDEGSDVPADRILESRPETRE